MQWPGFKEVLSPMGKGAVGEVGKVVGGALGAALLAWLLTLLSPVRAVLDTPLSLRGSTVLVACLVLPLVGALVVYVVMRRRVARLMQAAATEFAALKQATTTEIAEVRQATATEIAAVKQAAATEIAALTQAAAMDFALGIYNAAECAERMAQMLKLYVRDKRYLCTFVLLDLDSFKEVNESHGYAGGDAILTQFVDVMRRSTRESDVICRYRSGDEFLVILPQSLLAGGFTVAERIRERTERFAFQTVSKEKSVRMTVSAGVFCLDTAPEAPTVEHVKEQLEEYLRVAKLKKNRVVVRDGDDLPELNIE